MRIAMVAPPWIPVPPRGYGGIEWVVHLLAEELAARGHDVTLFATGDSQTSAQLVAVFDEGQAAYIHGTMHDALHFGTAIRAIRDAHAAGRRFDVLHDHTPWIAVAAEPLLPLPLVHTFHGTCWPQPFGLVMAEVMACGTPVIAFPKGAVPEIVVDGETGFVVEDADEMIKAVRRAGEISAQRCRAYADERFSPAAMTDGYLGVYEAAIAR